MSLFPFRLASSIRTAAAADYFCRNPASRFLSELLAGLILLERKPVAGKDPLAPLVQCLEENSILILFPEGSRGSPDVMGNIKPGLWHLARRCLHVPIHSVYLHGLGRSLPKGSWIPVPLFADICVGEPFSASVNKKVFPEQIKTLFENLRSQTLAGIAALHDDDAYKEPRVRRTTQIMLEKPVPGGISCISQANDHPL